MGEVTDYPTIEFTENPEDYGLDKEALFVDGASRYDKIRRGITYVIVPLLPGWVLRREGGLPVLYRPCDESQNIPNTHEVWPCRKCDGDGLVRCAQEGQGA